MKPDVFSVDRERQREELASDLERGGYVLLEGDASTERYFEKDLVLTRPGLLSRSGRLMADLVPAECDRIAVCGVSSCTLGTALSQETGIPMLLGRGDDLLRFTGEPFSMMKAVLIEDVVDTGRRALIGARCLQSIGTEVLSVVALLDRQHGAAQRLAEAGFVLQSLFTESELAAQATPAWGASV